MAARTNRWRLLAAESSKWPRICFRDHPPIRQGTLARSEGRSSSIVRSSLISLQNAFATLVDIPSPCAVILCEAKNLLLGSLSARLLLHVSQLRQHLFGMMLGIHLGPYLHDLSLRIDEERVPLGDGHGPKVSQRAVLVHYL